MFLEWRHSRANVSLGPLNSCERLQGHMNKSKRMINSKHNNVYLKSVRTNYVFIPHLIKNLVLCKLFWKLIELGKN